MNFKLGDEMRKMQSSTSYELGTKKNYEQEVPDRNRTYMYDLPLTSRVL